jgi:hypothetical protein
MQILGTDAYRTALSEALNNSHKVSLVSAYLTIEGIDWILDRLSQRSSCRVLSRWNCSDLVSGASDIEVFESLKARDYKLYILPDLHAKVFVIDEEKLFLGSANITNSGLKLVPGGNREIGTILLPDDEDLALIDNLFEESVLITQDIYEAFYAELQKLKESSEKPPRHKWSSNLLNKLRKLPERLWVTETLWCNSPDELLNNLTDSDAEVAHDLALLGLDIKHEINEIVLQRAFLESRILLWLKNKLQSTPNQEMYYGQLSAELHNSFLDDPKPYRKDVKGLLTNLLNWSQGLCENLIIIDRPNHSQRIRIAGS